MPRYFFDVLDGDITADDDGKMVESRGAVEAIALRIMLDVARFELMKSSENGLSVIVRDESGTEVYRTELTVRAGWLDKAE